MNQPVRLPPLGLLARWLWPRLPGDRLRAAIHWSISTRLMVSAQAVVRGPAGAVLLFHHAYDRRQPWGLPSGHLRWGERFEEVLARELAEEAGLEVEVERVLAAYPLPGEPAVAVAFACRLAGGSFRPSLEVDAAAWFLPGALPPNTRREHAELLHQLAEGARRG